jgi:hypothetical protein
MDRSPFALKPSLFVMIPLIAIIVALIGIAARHHAPPLLLGALGVSALSLAVITIAPRR